MASMVRTMQRSRRGPQHRGQYQRGKRTTPAWRREPRIAAPVPTTLADIRAELSSLSASVEATKRIFQAAKRQAQIIAAAFDEPTAKAAYGD